MRDGRSLTAKIVNPFALATPLEEKTMRRQLLASMNGTQIDVAVKRQNTVRFFRAIDSRAERRRISEKYRAKKMAAGVAAAKATS